jgi:hypothetical protein
MRLWRSVRPVETTERAPAGEPQPPTPARFDQALSREARSQAFYAAGVTPAASGRSKAAPVVGWRNHARQGREELVAQGKAIRAVGHPAP